MTKEEIIATAIHEAFLCGKESGEESNRMYHTMQQKIEDAKQGKSVIDNMAKHDGFLPHIVLAKLKEENEKLGKILEEKDATITELRAQLDEYKDCNQEFFRKEIAERDNIIGEERAEMQDMGRRINNLVNENLELLGRYNKLELELAELRSQPESVVAEPSDCIHFSEGDQVLVSGKFFGDFAVLFQGTILSVAKDYARVLITERDSDFEDDESNVPYEYLSKA